MKNRNLLLLSILLTNLICTFAAGHGIGPLVLIEYIAIIGVTSGIDNELPALWPIAIASLWVGQILLLVAMFKKDKNVFGRMGIIGLTIAVLSIYFALPEQVWYVTLLTSTSFLTLSIIFWGKSGSKLKYNR